MSKTAHFNKPRKCRYCDNLTKFNPKTGKYSVICSDPKCAELAKLEFRERMNKKYGKTHLLNDGDHQVKMAEGKAIPYRWSDGTIKHCLSKNEVRVCEFLDKAGFPSEDVIVGTYVIEYEYTGVKKNHIVDIYIPSVELIISVKDGLDNPNTRPSVIANRSKNWAQFEHIRKNTDMSFIQIEGNDSLDKILDVLLEIKKLKYKKRVIVEPRIDKHFMESNIPSMSVVSVLDIKRNGLYAGTVVTKSLESDIAYALHEGMLVERPFCPNDVISGKYYVVEGDICFADHKSPRGLSSFLMESAVLERKIEEILYERFDLQQFAESNLIGLGNIINIGVDIDE